MKTKIFHLIMLVGGLFLASCNKYEALNGSSSISGIIYLKDDLTPSTPMVVGRQPLYLAEGRDTINHLFQTMTDSMGRYSIANLQTKKEYTLYTRYVKNNTEYSGAVTFTTLKKDEEGLQIVDMTVIPRYINGLSLTFSDSLGGPLALLPFRLYTSKLAATHDSVRYAYVNSQSDMQGQFHRFNVPTGKYFVVASLDLGGITQKAFDSVAVGPVSVSKKTVVLR